MAADSADIEQLLRGITIPSPPQIIADLQMEMAMPDPDLNAIAALISNDVGLSGAVIKIINSPRYGINKEIGAISQAVLLLGMKVVMDIINTVCLRNISNTLDTMTDNVYNTLTRFWDSASDVAKACELVAIRIGMSSLSNAYLLGLFHNVGIALMIAKHDRYLDLMVDSYAQSDVRLVDVENEAFNTNHAVISYYTAKSWKVDRQVCKVISIHHNSAIFTEGHVIDSAENQMLGVLKIAEHIVGLHRVLGDQEVDHEWDKIGDNVLLSAGLTHFELDDLKGQASDLGYGQQLYFR